MSAPTPLEAQVLWLSATGLSRKHIASELGCTENAVKLALTAARRKAIAAGVSITHNPHPPTDLRESGFLILKRLAAEAGLTK
jgi:DNA-binding transcriptional regulator LsrR (DeoR family)